MKKNIFLLFGILIILSGCTKQVVNRIPDGTYTGTFIRTSPKARYAPANVSLVISGNRYSGTSDKDNYPAICSGSYLVQGSMLKVKNACVFTADVDRSLIFNGDFEYTFDGTKLQIVKKYSLEGKYDTYILQKVR
jgi:hypothetical protein